MSSGNWDREAATSRLSDQEGNDRSPSPDDTHFAHDTDNYIKPSWQIPNPTHFAKTPQNRNAGDVELLAIYRETAILDHSASGENSATIRILQIQPGLTGFRIHCKLVRRPLWDAGEYCALSYSWGKEEQNAKIFVGTRCLPEHPLHVSPHLWNALNRLREKDQAVNIWVDAICIDQQNDVERCAQVQIMGQIFNQASQVRIWLGEEDFPDPGSVADVERFWCLCNEPWPWWKRLWIVQECAYAAKCPIVMLGAHSMSYEKLLERWSSAMRREDFKPNQFKTLQSNFEFLQIPYNIWKMQNNNGRHRLPLAQRLEEMAGRQCTDPHDRIYALLSLIEEHEEKQLRPDYGKPFPELVLEVLHIVGRSSALEKAWDRKMFSYLDVQPSVIATLSDDLPPQDYANALRSAIHEGNLRIIEILIRKCRDSQVGRKRLDDALYRASYEGYEEVVKMLLDGGANVNAQGSMYSNALQAASRAGRERIVQILLDAGADVNAQGGVYGIALQAASYQGSEKIVQMLIDAGADANIQGGRFGNALQAASYRGSERIVQVLIATGPDVNAQGGEYGTALQAASYRRRGKVVRMLMDAGALTVGDDWAVQTSEGDRTYAADDMFSP